MISYERIIQLEEYRKLIDMGCLDVSTDLLKSRSNLRIFHPLNGRIGIATYNRAFPSTSPYLVIHQNGYVRNHTSSIPYPIMGLKTNPLERESEWNEKLKNTRKHLIQLIVKDQFSVKSRKIQNYIADTNSWGESVLRMFQEIKSTLLQFIEKNPKSMEPFLIVDGIEEWIAKIIMKNPNKWIFPLKQFHSEISIRKTIALLPPELGKIFKKDLDLLGDLHSIGL